MLVEISLQAQAECCRKDHVQWQRQESTFEHHSPIMVANFRFV